MEPTIYYLEVSFSGLLLKEVKPMPLDYCNNKRDSGMLKAYLCLCRQNEICLNKAHKDRQSSTQNTENHLENPNDQPTS